MVEYVLSMTLVYEVKGITKTHVLQNENGDKKEFSIQTEGVNYEACWNCDFIDPNKIHSNDIQSIHKTYGVIFIIQYSCSFLLIIIIVIY